MSIEVNKVLQKCRQEMQNVEQNSSFNNVIRRPDRPILLMFLGKHRQDCIEEVRHTIEMNWPQHSHAILYKNYQTPEMFRASFNEDEYGNIEMEDSVISQCNPQKGFATRNNVIIGYFLDLNNAEEYIDILNQPFNPPAGGVVTRFVLGICKFSRSNERRKALASLQMIDLLAKNREHSKTWSNTHVVSISDFMRGGSVLPEEEKAEGYAIATELLVIYNSVTTGQGRAPILPYVTANTGNFITGAFKRKEKPRDEINRTILYQYLVRCQELIDLQEEESPNHGEDILNMLNQCVQLIQKFFSTRVKPEFPQESDMVGFPFNISNALEAGEMGGEDKTLGIWKVYKKLYFENAVSNAFKNEMRLVEYFEINLGSMFSCGQIKQKFSQLKLRLQEGKEIITPYIPQNTSFMEYGMQAASKVMIECALPAMEQAIDNLLEGAKTYRENINRIQQQLYPGEQDVMNFYLKEVNQYLDSLPGSDEIIKEMKRPCTEDVLEQRILAVYKSLLNCRPVLHLSFEKELEARTDANNAAQQIASVLNVSDSQMEDVIRMHVSSVVGRIGDYALINPQADYVHQCDIQNQKFEVSRTDCLDRVAFYSFNVNEIL